MKSNFSMWWILLAAGIACSCDNDVNEEKKPDSGAGDDTDSNIDTSTDTDPENDSDTADPARFDSLIESVEQELDIYDAPGVAVAVLEGGEVTFARGFGSKHPEEDDPVEATTLFRVGSVNKMLTAAGLLQLVESGEVDLTAPITDYLADFGFVLNDTWAPSIRVEHLITHMTGINDYLEIDAQPGMQDDDALDAYINGEYSAKAYLMAPAGRMYNYSNPNFYLAGLITEKVSGTYYRQYMTDNVFSPLGMARTYFTPDEVLADGDFAYGLNNQIEWRPALPAVIAPETYENPWARPAGYAWSSVLDLAEFVKFLRDGNTDVLADDLREAMWAPQVDTKEFLDRRAYGYGLMILKTVQLESFYNVFVVTHNGAIPGFSANVWYVPELDFGFVTLANVDGAYFEASFAGAVQALCELPEPIDPPDLNMDPSTYDRYIGEFSDNWNVGTIYIGTEGDALTIEMPLLQQVDPPIPYDSVLIPYAPDNFILGIQGTQLLITFLFDENDQVEYLRTRAFVGGFVDSPDKQMRSMMPPLAGPEELLRTLRLTSSPLLLGARR